MAKVCVVCNGMSPDEAYEKKILADQLCHDHLTEQVRMAFDKGQEKFRNKKMRMNET